MNDSSNAPKPTKSSTMALPSAAPRVAWNHKLGALNNMIFPKKKRKDRGAVASRSLGFEHWNWEASRQRKDHIDGDKMNERVCSW